MNDLPPKARLDARAAAGADAAPSGPARLASQGLVSAAGNLVAARRRPVGVESAPREQLEPAVRGCSRSSVYYNMIN
jgi:hypothetical protein